MNGAESSAHPQIILSDPGSFYDNFIISNKMSFMMMRVSRYYMVREL